MFACLSRPAIYWFIYVHFSPLSAIHTPCRLADLAFRRNNHKVKIFKRQIQSQCPTALFHTTSCQISLAGKCHFNCQVLTLLGYKCLQQVSKQMIILKEVSRNSVPKGAHTVLFQKLTCYSQM